MNRGRWVSSALGATGVVTAVLCAISLAPAAVAKKGTVPPCVKNSKLTWGYDESSRYPFRIWYPKGEGRDESAKARYLKDQMNEHIWRRLTELMHTKPIADPQEICLVGDVGHKDSTGNTKTPTSLTDPCSKSPAEILVLDSLDEQHSRDVLAHEFMHALQFSLSVKCKGTWWWRESSAEWAEDFVYPHDNREHGFTKSYIGDMDHPINDPGDNDKDREYGSSIFPFFIARELQPELISQIWHGGRGPAADAGDRRHTARRLEEAMEAVRARRLERGPGQRLRALGRSGGRRPQARRPDDDDPRFGGQLRRR